MKLTAENKTVVLSDLVIIESQIENRRDLLKQIEEEILLIDEDILSRAFQKEERQLRVDSLREQYNVVLRAVYKERALRSPLLGLLASESVSMGLLKANVYSRLRDYVGQKLEKLRTEQKALEKEIQELNRDRQEKNKVMSQVTEQSQLLKNEQARQQVMIASLNEDENLLKSNLEIQRRNREEMNDQIEQILRSDFADISSETADTENTVFSSLKGSMNWPVTGGVISGKYGVQPHPTMKNLTISNNGIDIRAPLNSEVRAVDSGKVVSVSKMSGFGTTIIIEHGPYFTVYSRLASSTVDRGEVVKAGLVLGQLEVNDGSSELHFEIWKDNKTQNPQEWLK